MAFENVNFGLLVALISLASFFLFVFFLFLLNSRCCFRLRCRVAKWRAANNSVHVVPLAECTPAVLFNTSRPLNTGQKTLSIGQSILEYDAVDEKLPMPSSSSTLLMDAAQRLHPRRLVPQPRIPPIPMDLSSIRNVSIQIPPDEVYGFSENRSVDLYETHIQPFGKATDRYQAFHSTEAPLVECDGPCEDEINGSRKYPVDHALESIILEGQLFTAFQKDTPVRTEDIVITELNDSFLENESMMNEDQTLASSLAWDTFMPTPVFMTRSPNFRDLEPGVDVTFDRKSTLF